MPFEKRLAPRIKPSRASVIPLEVHEWRQKNWPMIERLEERKGDALILQGNIRRISQIAGQRISEGKITPKRLHNAARAIQFTATKLTDELIKRADEKRIPHGSFNEEYWNCLMHFGKMIPDIVMHEIVFQMKFDNPNEAQKKAHEELISRLVGKGHGQKK